MKTTSVWCFVFSVLVLSKTVFSKSISGSATSPQKKSVQRPFFAGGSPPTGLPGTSQGIEIQQTLPYDPPGTPPYFVSLFDSTTNTPFYSAYKVTPAQSTGIGNERRPGGTQWRESPGVPELKTAYIEAIEENGRRLGGQRPNQQLTKGHLNPSAINSFDTKFMIATYTFTNAVPQFAASNCYLTKFEKKVEDYAKENCGQRDGTLYLLTGRSENGLLIREGKAVQDSTNQIPKPFLTDMFVDGTIRLVTPRSIWTAVCCIWQVPGEEKRAESFAVMSNNQDKRSNVHQTEMSVPELEELLVTPHNAEINLFPGEEECRRPENYLHYEESIDENRLFRVKKISQKP